MKKLTIESIRLEGNQVQCSLLIGKNRELLITLKSATYRV